MTALIDPGLAEVVRKASYLAGLGHLDRVLSGTIAWNSAHELIEAPVGRVQTPEATMAV